MPHNADRTACNVHSSIWHFFILRGIEKLYAPDFFNITTKASIPPDIVPVAN